MFYLKKNSYIFNGINHSINICTIFIATLLLYCVKCQRHYTKIKQILQIMDVLIWKHFIRKKFEKNSNKHKQTPLAKFESEIDITSNFNIHELSDIQPGQCSCLLDSVVYIPNKHYILVQILHAFPLFSGRPLCQ